MSEIRRRKSSIAITLTLAGTVTLASCSDESSRVRDIYATKADCVHDWGDENRCEAEKQGTGSGAHGGSSGGSRYYGPEYSSNGGRESAATTRPGSRAIGSSVSRGGFGSLGSFFHGGGG